MADGIISRAQEALRSTLADSTTYRALTDPTMDQAAALAQARGQMGVVVKEAQAGLAAEAEAAKQNLEAESEALAEQIAHRLLERRAS